MKKILNWSIGSFFRTLGRIIAYLSVGLLIFSILSKSGSGFKLNDLLPIMKVSAATTDGKYISNMYSNENLTGKYSFDYNKGGYYSEFYNNYENRNWYFSPINFENNIYSTVYVPITISDPNSILSITKNQTGLDIINELGATISVRAIWNEDWLSWCYSTEIKKNNNSVIYKCNVPNTRTSLKGLNVHIADTSTGSNILDTAVTVGVGDTFDFEISSNKTNEDIKNSVNDIKDSINNDNVDGSINTASNLFNNYSETDFGLSGVITAPLNLIRSLTSKTCSQLVLPIPFTDKSLTLPCLSSIYREHFNGILSIYQIVLFAIVGYRVCISIFFMVKGFKDPNKDEIEVMDL